MRKAPLQTDLSNLPPRRTFTRLTTSARTAIPAAFVSWQRKQADATTAPMAQCGARAFSLGGTEQATVIIV